MRIWFSICTAVHPTQVPGAPRLRRQEQRGWAAHSGGATLAHIGELPAWVLCVLPAFASFISGQLSGRKKRKFTR